MSKFLSLEYSSASVELLESKKFSKNTIDLFNFCYIPIDVNTKTDLLWGRLGLPIKNIHDETIAYAGRRVDVNLPNILSSYKRKYNNYEYCSARVNKWNKSKWINEPYDKNRNLFNLNNAAKYIYEYNFAIIVEGYFDVISMHDKGIFNCVACCGTSISKYQIHLLKSFCDFVYIFFDGDLPGQLASENAQQNCEKFGLKSTILSLPNKKDPDEYISTKNGNKFKSFLVEYTTKDLKKIILN